MEEVKIIALIGIAAAMLVVALTLILTRRADKQAYHLYCLRFPYRVVETVHKEFWIQKYEPKIREWKFDDIAKDRDEALEKYYKKMSDVVARRIGSLSLNEREMIAGIKSSVKEILLVSPNQSRLVSTMEKMADMTVSAEAVNYTLTAEYASKHSKSTEL